jgi:hypothetical protein
LPETKCFGLKVLTPLRRPIWSPRFEVFYRIPKLGGHITWKRPLEGPNILIKEKAEFCGWELVRGNLLKAFGLSGPRPCLLQIS